MHGYITTKCRRCPRYVFVFRKQVAANLFFASGQRFIFMTRNLKSHFQECKKKPAIFKMERKQGELGPLAVRKATLSI